MLDPRNPFLDLWINGRSMQAGLLRHLISVEVTESVSELDSVSIQLAVPELPFEVLSLAQPGSRFEVFLGYNAIPIRSISGDIVEITHEHSTTGARTLTLTGLDSLHRLQNHQAASALTGTHSAIVRAIASECGFIPDVQEVNATEGGALRLEEDYATFLMRLARANNYFVRIEKNGPHDPKPTLRFGRRSLPALHLPVVLVWGLNTEKVNVHYSLKDLVGEVVVRGRDYTQDVSLDGRANSAHLRRISGGETGVELSTRAFGSTRHTVDNSPDSQSTGVQDRAVAELQQRAEHFLSGDADCLGMPEARSGAEVFIEGAGWPLSGRFLIEKTTHSFDASSGYHTTIHFYSDSLPPRIGF